MEQPETTIIIRAYNEEKKIGQCLTSVFNQEYKNFEVLVVDSGSTDNTLEIAKKFPLEIVQMKKSDFTYGRALNIGCKNAKGKYFVFLSAHAIPAGNKWLYSILQPLKDENVAGVSGKQIPSDDCNPLSKRAILDHWGKDKKRPPGNIEFCNANSSVAKKIWEKFPFNEDLAASEDYDWAKRVIQNGFSIYYEPEAAAMHSHNEKYKQIFSRHYREFYTAQLINNAIDFNLISLGPYCFLHDVFFIIKNNYSYSWIIRSLLLNVLLEISATASYIKFAREKISIN